MNEKVSDEVYEPVVVENPELPEAIQESKEVSIMDELSLSAHDITRVAEHLEKVKEAVSSIMKSGIDRDYAVIPGTYKPSLLKPGAEKLLRLFGLGSRIERTGEIFDHENNFVKYDYMATVFHIRSGKDVASCEGTCSSKESKYKKVVAQKGVCDITNTLMKMAQKRALVGATIYAVGASDYFAQDLEDMQKTEPERTNGSDFKSNGSAPGDYVIEIGKYKGQTIRDVGAADIMSYCTFITNDKEGKEIKGKMKILIDTARDYLKTQPKG